MINNRSYQPAHLLVLVLGLDARHNIPRIGRILIARGRDAADVAISTTFGQTSLKSFVVTTREVEQEVLSSGEAPMMAWAALPHF